MEFQTLKKDNKKKYILGLIVVSVIVVTITYIGTRAKYRVTNSAQLASGVINYSTSDLELVAVKLQNDSNGYDNSDTIPISGYTLNTELSICKVGETKQDVTITYENGKVGISGITTKGTKCQLYFDVKRIASETLIAKGEMVNENGYRYEGANPNNYVTFNDELWRIIGVFEVENSDTEQTESLVKLIRSDTMVDVVWDGNKSNDWTNSTLKTLLNEGDYYNRVNTYSTNGLTSEARSMIQQVKWNLGGSSNSSITAEQFYTAEHGTTGGAAAPDITEWNGYVGLLYLSDYGYAVDSTSCVRTTTLYNYNNTSCKTTNWLYSSSYGQWTITPISSIRSGVFYMSTSGSVTTNSASFGCGVRPTIYLKSNVQLVNDGNDGSEAYPYNLSM